LKNNIRFIVLQHLSI